MRKENIVGLIYGSDTGVTEEITHTIIEEWNLCEINVIEVTEASKEFFGQYDLLILGLSTWYDGDLQSDWENYFDEFSEIDFSGKTVALYGLGDQYGYHDYFIDGVGILAEVILRNGGEVVGHWPSKEYDFTESKALTEDEECFYGLAIDEDNEPELTRDRIKDWLEIINEEFANRLA